MTYINNNYYKLFSLYICHNSIVTNPISPLTTSI